MSLTGLEWALLASSAGLSALLVLALRSRGAQADMAALRAGLEDIGARFKRAELTDADADAARLALLSRANAPAASFGAVVSGLPRPALVTAAVFLLVAGIGAAMSTVTPEATVQPSASASISHGEDEDVVRLQTYAGAAPGAGHASTAAPAATLPDVNTMIERLAARLETTPDDGKGWQLLGWSYYHTGSFARAATAFAKAVKLDPNSAELKSAYDEATAKAAAGATKTE